MSTIGTYQLQQHLTSSIADPHELLNESHLGPGKWLTYTLSSFQKIKKLKKVAD